MSVNSLCVTKRASSVSKGSQADTSCRLPITGVRASSALHLTTKPSRAQALLVSPEFLTQMKAEIPHYIRQRHSDKLAHFKMPFMARDESLYRNVLSLFSASDSWMSASSQDLALALSKRPRFKAALASSIQSELKARTGGELDFEDCEKMASIFVRSYLSQGDFRLTHAISELVGGSERLLQRLNVQTVAALSKSIQGIDRDIERSVVTSLGYRLVNESELKGESGNEFFVVNDDGVISFVTVQNHFQPEYEPVDREIYENDLKEHPDRANLARFFDKHYGEQEKPKRRDRQGKNNRNHWGESHSFSKRSRSKSQFSDNMWNDALEKEKATQKNPTCKAQVNVSEARQRDGLCTTQDAIIASAELIINGLDHFNAVGEFLGFNTRFYTRPMEPNEPQLAETDNRKKNTAQHDKEKINAPKLNSPKYKAPSQQTTNSLSMLSNLACLGVAASNPTVRVASSVLCIADSYNTYSDIAAAVAPSFNLDPEQALSSPKKIDEESEEFSLFLQYIALPDCDPAWVLYQYASLTNAVNANQVGEQLRANPQVIQRFLSSELFFIQDPSIQNVQLQFLYELLDPSYKESSLPFLYFKNKYEMGELSALEFLHSVFKLQDNESIDQAKNYILENEKFILELEKEISLTDLATSFVASRAYKIIKGEINVVDFFKDTEEIIIYNLIHSLLEIPDILENKVLKEILLTSSSYIFRYFKSTVYNDQNEEAKNEKIEKLNFIYNENSLERILNTFNRDREFNEERAIANLIEKSIFMFIPKEREQAAFYLLNHRNLIESYKNGAVFQSYNDSTKEIISKEISALLSDLDLTDILTPQELIEILTPVRSRKASPEMIEKLLFLFPDKIIQSVDENNDNPKDKNSNRLYQIELVLYQNIDGLRNYLRSELYKNLTSSLKEKREALIINIVKKFNRLFFKEGIINMPLASLFEDNEHIEHQRDLVHVTQERLASIENLTQQLNALKVEPTTIEIEEKISKLEEEIKKEKNLADHQFYIGFATMPSIKTFNQKLEEEGKKLTLNDLLMLKNFIIAASKGEVSLDNNTIDEAIELFGVLQKIEPVLWFQYKKIIEGSPMGQYTVALLEEEYDGITLGAIIQSEIKKSRERTGVKTCDVEEYLVPILMPTTFVDMLISLAGAVKKYFKAKHHSKFMQLAVRYQFFQEGKNRIENSHALKMDYLLYVTEKHWKEIVGQPLSKLNVVTFGFYRASTLIGGDLFTWPASLIYDDMAENRNISSLSAEEIEKILFKTTIFKNLMGAIPFISSAEEWFNSFIKMSNGVRGEELACSFAKAFASTATELLDYVSFTSAWAKIKKITKKSLFQQINKRANAALPAMDASTLNNIKSEFLAAGFARTYVTSIFNKLKKLDIADDPEILRAILAQNCDISLAEKIKLSKLSANQFENMVTNFKHYYPDLFNQKFSSFKDQAKAMRQELFNTSANVSIPSIKSLEQFFANLDEKQISMQKGKLLLAEKLKLGYEDKLRFTGLTMPEYIKIFTDLSKHHPEFVKKNIYSLDGLDLKRVSVLQLLKEQNILQDETTILPAIESFYKKHNSRSLFNSIYQPLSLAHFLGGMSEDMLKKMESLKSDTAITATMNEVIGKYGVDLGQFNRFSNLLSYEKSAFITLGAGFSFAYLNADKTTGKKTLYLPRTNEFNQLHTPVKNMNQHVRAIEINDSNLALVSRWFEGKNMKGLHADWLTKMHTDTLMANTYEQLSSAMSIEYKQGVISIVAKGDKYITHTTKGMLDGKALAEEILANHADSVEGKRVVHFKAPFSGYGGLYSSAQVLANKLRVGVMGYEGDVELSKPVIFHPEPLGSPLIELAKAANAKFSSENQNLIAYLKPNFADFVKKSADFDLPYDPDNQQKINRYYAQNLKSITTEGNALAKTGKDIEAKHRARDIEYQKYEIVCRSKRGVGAAPCIPFPRRNLIDLLNKDYKLHQTDWDLTNDVKSVLRSMLVAEQISAAEFRKAAKLLVGNNRFNDYLQLFTGTATAAINLTPDIITESGAVSFTLTRDPLRVSHTAYIHLPVNGTPLLITSNRMDLDKVLSQAAQGEAAANTLAYRFTPEMAMKMQEWAGANGYDIKYTSVADFKRQIGLHPALDVTGYQHDVLDDYRVSFDGNELQLRVHGTQSLSGMPSGLATATNVAKYLKREHQQDLARASNVHLVMCFGAKGGTWNSQAQVISNEIGKPVVAYSGKINIHQSSQLSMYGQQRHTFYPQSGTRRYLTQALNEMIGDQRRAALLRSHPEWKEVGIEQTTDALLDRPFDFLRENKLEMDRNLNSHQQVYISNVGDNHYQLSNNPSAKSAVTRVGVIPVMPLSEAELAGLQGMPLSTFDANLLVTPELSSNIVALRKLGQETYMAHIKPELDQAGIFDTAVTQRMLQTLKAQGWQVFWDNSVQQNPIHFFAVKDEANWLFFKQQALASQNLVERIF